MCMCCVGWVFALDVLPHTVGGLVSAWVYGCCVCVYVVLCGYVLCVCMFVYVLCCVGVCVCVCGWCAAKGLILNAVR